LNSKRFYITGGELKGEDGSWKTVSSVRTFEIRGCKWGDSVAMNDVRREHSSCIMNTKLFVFGGFREYYRLDSIECLETDTSGSWELI